MTFDAASRDPWEVATAGYGAATVAHLLDLPLGQRPDSTDARRLEVVETLCASVNEQHLPDERRRVSELFHTLVQIAPEEELTTFERIRQYVGGTLPPNTGDELTDRFARLVYNGLAMEVVPGAELDRFLICAAFQDPRLCTPAATAFLDDPDLSRLFPGATRELDEHGYIDAMSFLTCLPANVGGTTHLPLVVGNFVEQTLARMRFMNALSENRIEEFVHESLDQLRRFARGEDVEVLVLTGLIGIQTSHSLDCDTWGIRPAAGLAIGALPVQDHPRPKSVLWMKVPHRLVSHSRDANEWLNTRKNSPKESRTFEAALVRKTMALRFSVLAWAVEREMHPINVQATTSWSLMPISFTQSPSVDGSAWLTGELVLEHSDLAAVADIVNEIGDVTPRLDIALSRMLRVTSEPREGADALIDAVVAWENMFGSKNETTFKVCAALAWLIEPDDECRRKELFSKAKKIYGQRSEIVHGSKDASLATEISPALVLAVRAFRGIHASKSLIDLEPSSRSDEILLRARPVQR